MAIKDYFGRLAKALSGAQQTQQARRMVVARHSTRSVATQWTPARMAGVLDAADQGRLAALADLGEEVVERDTHVFAELGKRRRALLTLDWRVVPPANASAAERKTAAWLDEALRALPNFEDVVLDMGDAIGHGYAALEIAWQRQGDLWLPREITRHPPNQFMTHRDAPNELRLVGGNNGEPLWPLGWITHIHRAKSGYIGRCGLHRVLAWPYMWKRWSVADWLEYLEIHGLPLRLGKYLPGTPEAEQKALLNALINLGHDSAAVVPEGLDITFVDAAKSSESPFLAMVELAERSVSKAVLGGTLTSQADGKTSTNALGTVHNEVRRDLLISDALQIAGTLTRDLLWPLATLNRGLTDPMRCPRFVYDTRDPADLALLAEALPKLVGVGYQVPLAWAHEHAQIPQPVDDEPVLQLTSQALAVSPATPTTGPLARLRERAGERAKRSAENLAGVVNSSAVAEPAEPSAEMLAAEEAALRFAADYQALLGPRVAQLLAMLEESGDLATFRDQLTALIADGPPPQALVHALTRGQFAAALSQSTDEPSGAS